MSPGAPGGNASAAAHAGAAGTGYADLAGAAGEEEFSSAHGGGGTVGAHGDGSGGNAGAQHGNGTSGAHGDGGGGGGTAGAHRDTGAHGDGDGGGEHAGHAGRGLRWIDSHCHIAASQFDEDRARVLDAAGAAGVETVVAIGSGYGIAHNQKSVALAQSDTRVFAAVGVHPHEASELNEAHRKNIGEWLDAARVVAVGECGLDYWYERSPRAVQREAFAWQVNLARERGLPVSIHVRGKDAAAYEELLDIWCSEGRGDVEGVLHCYTHDEAYARRAIDARLRISFSGILTFKKDRGLRAVAAALPLAELLVETDAPLLAPEGKRGTRNEPAHVALVGAALAAAQQKPLAQVAEATRENARRLFRL